MANITNQSESCVFPLAYKITVSSLLGVTLLLAPVMNSIVCIAILTTKQLHTSANLLIVSLSFGDILISVILPTLEIIYIALYPKWPIKKLGTTLLNSVWMYSLVGPFVTVAVITVERYKAITSFRIRSSSGTGTSRKLMVTIAIVWIYSLSSVAFMAAFFKETTGEYYEWNVNHLFYYPYLGIHIVVPLILITVLYCLIVITARKTRRQATKDVPNALNKISAAKEMKLAKTIGIVIGLLFAVWVPVLVLEYFYAIGTEDCWVQMAGPVSVWLTCSNGLVNPVVYNYRNQQLRKAMRGICFKSGSQTNQATSSREYHPTKGRRHCSSVQTMSTITESRSMRAERNKGFVDENTKTREHENKEIIDTRL